MAIDSPPLESVRDSGGFAQFRQEVARRRAIMDAEEFPRLPLNLYYNSIEDPSYSDAGERRERTAYSVRSAAIGLIPVARRAGSHVATNAAAVRTIGAAVKASGSSAPTS